MMMDNKIIKLSDNYNMQNVRQMWKICFNDTEEFMDIYFSEKYLNDNTLLYFENNSPVASLQMLPYYFTFYGVQIPISYISGACTLPEFRNKGLMGKLLIQSFEVMKERKIPLSILIPADNQLCSYYKKFGFETVFDEGSKSELLKSILDEAITDFDNAFDRFNTLFRDKDFCIQKSKTDFKAIVSEAKLNSSPPKYNLSGMARLIDVEQLLNLFAAKNSDYSFSIELNDSILLQNNATYIIDKGVCIKTETKTDNSFKISVNILCQLLFGHHLEQFSNIKISQYFKSHEPVLNLMME